MRIDITKDIDNYATIYNCRIPDADAQVLKDAVVQQIAAQLAQQLTSAILDTDREEIIKMISTAANKALSELGAQIDEIIRKKLPDKINEVGDSGNKYISENSHLVQ